MTETLNKTVFLWTNGKFNWTIFLWLIIGAVVSVGIFLIVSFTLKLAILANLNTGIVITIWAINPFTSALMDFCIYRSPLQQHHLVGMVFLIMCAVFVSVSGGKDAAPNSPTEIIKEAALPAWCAILCSVAMPVACTFQVAMQKYVTVNLHMSANDFTFGSQFIMAVVL